MFGNGLSFSGLASGLDTKSIIDQLVALERLPIHECVEHAIQRRVHPS